MIPLQEVNEITSKLQ